MRGNGVCRSLARGVFVGMAWSLLSLGPTACGDRAERRQEAVDTLTQRQRDSLLSTMPVPGAGAVGKALEAADRARERAEQHDTMRD
jgi:hypothetical protein